MMILGTNIDLRPVEIDDAAFILSLRLDPELNQYLSNELYQSIIDGITIDTSLFLGNL